MILTAQKAIEHEKPAKVPHQCTAAVPVPIPVVVVSSTIPGAYNDLVATVLGYIWGIRFVCQHAKRPEDVSWFRKPNAYLLLLIRKQPPNLQHRSRVNYGSTI